MYLGVKYIGGNASKEDTICNSGAIWNKGDVLNFEEDSARKLAVHNDSFVLVDMSPNAKTFANKAVGATDNYEPFPSLAGMDAMQIANLASVRYGIKIDIEGRTKEDVVFDALNRIKAANLRADATDLGVKVLPVVSMTLSEDEYKSYLAGKLALRLMPVVKEKVIEKVDAVVLTPVFELVVEDEKSVKGAEKETEEASLPTLTELLASLSTKKELQAFAKENNVTYANSMNESQLRAKLLRELTK